MPKQIEWMAKAVVYFVEETTGVEYEPGEVVEGISLKRAKQLQKQGYVSLKSSIRVQMGPEEMKA